MIKRILKSKIFLTFVCTILVGLFVFSLVFFPTLNSQDETSNLPDSNVSTPAPNDDQITSQATGEWKDDRSSSWSTDSSGNYLISDGKQLAKLAYDVNTGASTYSGVTFKLTNNIDLSEHYWNPIGVPLSLPFSGILDGNNYCIYGLEISQTYNSNEAFVGLFGYLCFANVRNLIVIGNINVTANTPIKIGGITGYCDYSTIQNCMSDVTINLVSSDIHYVGGIAGFAYGDRNRSSIIQCANTADINVNATKIDSSSYTGGITGNTQNDVTIESCINYGIIDAKSIYVGGIAGYVYNSYSRDNSKYVTITKCINVGSVKKTKSPSTNSVYGYVGGLIGYMVASSSYDTYKVWDFWPFASHQEYKYYYASVNVTNCRSKAGCVECDSGSKSDSIAYRSNGTFSGYSSDCASNPDSSAYKIIAADSDYTLISNYKNIKRDFPILAWTCAPKEIKLGIYVESIDASGYNNALPDSYKSSQNTILQQKGSTTCRIIRTPTKITLFDITYDSFLGYQYIGVYSADAATNRDQMDKENGYPKITDQCEYVYKDGTYGAYADLPNSIGAFFNRNEFVINNIHIMKRNYVPDNILLDDFHEDNNDSSTTNIKFIDDKNKTLVNYNAKDLTGKTNSYYYSNNIALYQSTLNINVNLGSTTYYDYEIYGVYLFPNKSDIKKTIDDPNVDNYLLSIKNTNNSTAYTSLEFEKYINDINSSQYIYEYEIYIYLIAIRQTGTINAQHFTCKDVNEGYGTSDPNDDAEYKIYRGYYTEDASIAEQTTPNHKLIDPVRVYHRGGRNNKDNVTPYIDSYTRLNNPKGTYFRADASAPIYYRFCLDLSKSDLLGEQPAEYNNKTTNGDYPIIGGGASLTQGFLSTSGFSFVNKSTGEEDINGLLCLNNKVIYSIIISHAGTGIDIGKAMLATLEIKFVKYVSEDTASASLFVYTSYETPYDPNSQAASFKEGNVTTVNYSYVFLDDDGLEAEYTKDYSKDFDSKYVIETITEGNMSYYKITFDIKTYALFDFNNPSQSGKSGGTGISDSNKKQTLNHILSMKCFNTFNNSYYAGYRMVLTDDSQFYFSSSNDGYSDKKSNNISNISLYDLCFTNKISSAYCFFTFEEGEAIIRLHNSAASDGIKVRVNGELKHVDDDGVQGDDTFGNTSATDSYLLKLENIKSYSLIEFEIARNFSFNNIELSKFVGIYAAFYRGEYSMGVADENIEERQLLSWDQYYSFRFVPVLPVKKITEGDDSPVAEKRTFMIIIEYEIYNKEQTQPEQPKRVGNEYQITKPEDLYWIATQLALPAGQNVNGFKGITFRQMNDINFLDTTMLPIGYEQSPFMGIYDGQNYKITNLVMNQEYNTLRGVGLFGYIKNATIKNLEFENCQISGFSNVGVAVGYAENSNVINVRVYDSRAYHNSIYPSNEPAPKYSYNLVVYYVDDNVICRYIDGKPDDYVPQATALALLAGADSVIATHISGLLCGGVENSSVEVCLSYNAVANGDYDGVFIGQILYDDIADWAITYCVTNATLYDYNFNKFDFSNGENNLLETKYHCHDGQLDFNSLKSDDADPECYRKFWW